MVATRDGLMLDEFLALPDKEVALEFADAEVTQMVSPHGKHSTLQADLAAEFSGIFRPHKIARAFTELRATWAGTSPVPDVSVNRWERLPRDPRNRVATRFDTSPDIAVEIVSPEQRVTGLIRRCLRFAATGVPLTYCSIRWTNRCWSSAWMNRIARWWATTQWTWGTCWPAPRSALRPALPCLKWTNGAWPARCFDRAWRRP